MKTVILCGGKGLRYGKNRTKGLAMIGNMSIIQHVVNIYYQQYNNEFIIISGYKNYDIEKYFRQINHEYIIHYINIREKMNKGGSLKLAQDYIGNDRNFFCTYCDTIANVNLIELSKIHSESDNIATITAIKPVSEYGIIEFGDNNKIVEFKEKPVMNEWTNGGFFVFTKDIFEYIISPEDNLETDVFQRLVEKNKIGGYKHTGFWNTVNTQKDEENLNKLYENSIRENKELDWYNIR